jgi:hypothetical protein
MSSFVKTDNLNVRFRSLTTFNPPDTTVSDALLSIDKAVLRGHKSSIENLDLSWLVPS